jgi:hypothetical protein
MKPGKKIPERYWSLTIWTESFSPALKTFAIFVVLREVMAPSS